MDSKSTPQQCIGIDGYQRSKEVEAELNSMFAGVFTQGAGAQILDYLRGISMNAVVPATESSNRLWQQEGMRLLFSIIQNRINAGKEEKKHVETKQAGVRTGNRGRIGRGRPGPVNSSAGQP